MATPPNEPRQPSVGSYPFSFPGSTSGPQFAQGGQPQQPESNPPNPMGFGSQPTPEPESARPRRTWPLVVGTAIIAGAVGAGAGYGGATLQSSSAPATTVTVTAEPTATAPANPSGSANPAATPTGDSSGIGNGIWKVGTDIQPGTYTAQVAPDSVCYYARLASESTEDVIDENLVSEGKVYVDIQPDDAYFQSDGCTLWEPA